MADQNITALPVSTTPESSDQLLLVGTTEEKLIDYDKLADAILNKLTSKNFSLDQGTMPLVSALNQLNSKALSDTRNLQEFSFKMPLDEKIYSVLLMYGATSKNYPFMYMVFVDTKANERGVYFYKVFDELSSSRAFEGTYNDTTTTLTIKSSGTVWAGLRIIAIK